MAKLWGVFLPRNGILGRSWQNFGVIFLPRNGILGRSWQNKRAFATPSYELCIMNYALIRVSLPVRRFALRSRAC